MSQMLLEIYDGRKGFWQWDVGQKLVVLDDTVTEVHLSHKNIPHSYDAKIYEQDGKRLCDIPDVFLQKPHNLVVYAYHETQRYGYTKTAIEISVRLRPRPDGYISVQDEEYDDIDGRIDALEESIAASMSEEEIKQHVSDELKLALNIGDDGVAMLDAGTVLDAARNIVHKYVYQLRRGTAQQWIDYESSDEYQRPQAGELVVEYNGDIPTLKVGDGVREYSELPKISVDSAVLPTRATISIKGGAENWPMATDDKGNALGYREQVVVVENATITPKSKIDLQITSEELVAFYNKSLAFTAKNNGGKVSIVCVGQIPQNDWTFRATVTEVVD